MSFSDKVVLITGASSGIGAAVALHFATLDAKLVLTGRNSENLNKVAEQCSGKTKPLAVVGDLTKESDVKNIFDNAIKHFGKLDVLVNNAGIRAAGGIENVSLEDYDRVFGTNLRPVYQLTKLAAPYLIKTKGNIINISSALGIRACGGLLAYCTSKAALDQFTKCVALDLGSKQVRVNSVNPGLIVTEFHRRSKFSEEEYQEFLKKAVFEHPLGRVGYPEEVAKAVAFLASEDASFITGTLLSVDGGWQLATRRQ